MRAILHSIIILAFVGSTQYVFAQKSKDYTKLVNPFIGTGGHGHTYPGAVLPFGMVQLSPDTRLDGWDGSSGYHYSDTTVYGFSHTHLSGTGIPDYCDILFMPTVGEPQFLNTAYRSGFSKKNEQAEPGYYKTYLNKYNVAVELTATLRAGMHRYNYPSASQANIIVDLQHRDKVLDSWIEIVNDREIRGFRHSQSWAQNQQVYFHTKFSKPFKSYVLSDDGHIITNQVRLQGKAVKLGLQFGTARTVIAKTGISSVSTEGALKNLDTEIPDFNFNQIRQQAKATWNKELARIQVEGGGPSINQQRENEQQNANYRSVTNTGSKSVLVDYAHRKQIIFYTALYHTMLAPNIYSDVDGQYRGMDQHMHKADGFNYYTVFSTWDTYRAEHPLLTLIDRKRTLDFVKSFLAMYEQRNYLPIWPLASNETFCMVGNHSIPIITDAYAKGITGFNAEEAFTAMKATVNRDQFGLDSYRTYGAVQADAEHESVSKTLEYAFDDWCVAQMAKMLHHQQDYEVYSKRAQYWKNLLNTENNFMQARTNGGWYQPFVPTDINNNYTEGNSWQYTFLVPQDVEGLIARMGGNAIFEAKLDELFSTKAKLTGRQQDDVSGLIGQYAHGNEPSHHMAYLFNFTSTPEKTQYYLNKIINEQYTDQPDGLAGNEDCGQMSAWYVLTSLGFYNIAPGQQQFQLGLPQFDKATIHLENGKKITVSNSGASVNRENIYLQGMNLNKLPYKKLYISFDTLANGADLEVFTGRLPNWLFMQDLVKPTSRNKTAAITAMPYQVAVDASFKTHLTVTIKSNEPNAQLYYTIDGTTPTAASKVYAGPIIVAKSTTVKAIAIKDGVVSFVDSARYNKIEGKFSITLNSKYSPAYAARGTEALIDGTHGTANWRLGNWQGYQGTDLEAVIDLGENRLVNTVSLGALQDSGSWIMFPRAVDYYTSIDGKTYKLAGTVKSKINDSVSLAQVQQFEATLNTKIRYIRVLAHQYGPLPEWHESKGQPSYIFADEITIK